MKYEANNIMQTDPSIRDEKIEYASDENSDSLSKLEKCDFKIVTKSS